MHAGKWSRWLVLLGVVVGCNAKLSVEPSEGGEGGVGGIPPMGVSGRTSSAGSVHTGSAGGGSAGVRNSDGGHPSAAGAAQVAGENGVGEGGALGFSGATALGGATTDLGGASPGPGDQGGPCVPGDTIDSGSGVAATKISTLDRCAPGLSCNNAHQCAAVPKCPNAAGKCVEYGTGGTGGVAGAGNQSSPAGAGGAGPGGAGQGQIPDESGVTGLAIDSTRLYWIQYGTRDSIGNYQNDGAVMTMKLADRSTAQLGGALAGPNAIALTNNHAYVIVDGAGFVGSISHPKLLRLSLTDGTTEVIQEGNPPVFSSPVTSFAASGDTMYWSGASTFFWLAGDSTAPSAGTRQAGELRTDATNLYFIDPNDKTVRTPLVGGALEELAIETRPYALNGDSIYGLENPQAGMILTKAAKTNGAWARVRALGEMYPAHLVFAGDRLFAEWTDGANRTGLTTATLGNNSAPVRMLDPASEAVRSWVGTASKVYWTDGPRIYSRAIPTP